VKLQKQLSRKKGEKKYPKYVITISPKHIEQLGWKEGEELNARIVNHKFIITKKKSLGTFPS
jgi:hypothetical protein